MDKRLYLNHDVKVFLGTSLKEAAEAILDRYVEGVEVGSAIYKKMTQFKNAIQTEEQQLEYINNIVDDVFDTYPVHIMQTERIVNNHRKNFIKYIIKCRIQEGLISYIQTLMKNY